MSRVFLYHIYTIAFGFISEMLSLITMEDNMIVWAAWKNTVSKDALRISNKPKFKPVKLRKKSGEIRQLNKEVQS